KNWSHHGIVGRVDANPSGSPEPVWDVALDYRNRQAPATGAALTPSRARGLHSQSSAWPRSRETRSFRRCNAGWLDGPCLWQSGFLSSRASFGRGHRPRSCRIGSSRFARTHHDSRAWVGSAISLRIRDWHGRGNEIGRAHVLTPVTFRSRMPSPLLSTLSLHDALPI